MKAAADNVIKEHPLLRGFSEADDRLDYQIETHPLFLERVRRARKAFHAGQSERLDDIRDELLQADDPI